MRYVSSRNKNIECSAHEAIIRGLAEDGGLYTPLSLDGKVCVEDLLRDSYPEMAVKVLSLMLDDYTTEEIRSCQIRMRSSATAQAGMFTRISFPRISKSPKGSVFSGALSKSLYASIFP